MIAFLILLILFIGILNGSITWFGNCFWIFWNYKLSVTSEILSGTVMNILHWKWHGWFDLQYKHWSINEPLRGLNSPSILTYLDDEYSIYSCGSDIFDIAQLPAVNQWYFGFRSMRSHWHPEKITRYPLSVDGKYDLILMVDYRFYI